MFDLFVSNRGQCVPAGPIAVQLGCRRCGARQPGQVVNAQWNSLTCSACRSTARRYVWVSPAMVDALDGRVGRVGVVPGFFDWQRIGEWSAFLGPGRERRAPLCLQFEREGLAGTSFDFQLTARRRDDQRVVAEQASTWTPCDCRIPQCRHNRMVFWLPPEDTWDQHQLDCDVKLTSRNGEVVFQDQMVLDIAPESTAPAESQLPTVTSDADRGADQIVDAFHNLYYYGTTDELQVWTRTFWLNVPCLQCPLDLWVFQEILSEVRPDLVIETGTMYGGNALYLAGVMDQLGHGRVVSIDIFDLPRPAHPRIRYVEGSSTDADLVHSILSERPGEKVMVILDSDHTRDHVLAELRLFAPYVEVGSYIIVTDTNINGHPVFPKYGPGPFEAVMDFLQECDEFEIDKAREKFKLTFNPSGFLRRVRRAFGVAARED